MENISILLPVLLLFLLVKLGEGIRCFTCRSDELPDCGDPFNPGRVPSNECDNYFTQQTSTCFKAHYAADKNITVRGCAPFTTETDNMQKGLLNMTKCWWYPTGREWMPCIFVTFPTATVFERF